MRRISKLVTFVGTLAAAMLAAQPAFAQAADAGTSAADKGWLGLAAALAVALAALGGGLGQGKAAAAALEGIARNPQASGKILTPMIIGLAFIESLVIYGLLISFLLLGKM